MSDIMEFGFEESKVIKPQGVDRLKLSRPNEVARISIIAFRQFHEVIRAQKERQKGSPLSEDEKKEIFAKIDSKLAEQLKKPVADLTEIDRLDIKSPKFSFAFTHYRDGLGSIRCLSKYNGTQLVKTELCCNELGDAEQQVATVVLKYPVDRDGQIDMDLLKQRKYTEVMTWRMSAKKFKRVEGVYIEARNHNMHVIDLKVTLDGDPKYQKFQIENGYTAAWAREDADPELRRWVLEQGLRSFKHVKGELGFELTKDKLLERLKGESASAAALSGGEASAPAPQQVQSYDNLLD